MSQNFCQQAGNIIGGINERATLLGPLIDELGNRDQS
jgi:hypothetical protein